MVSGLLRALGNDLTNMTNGLAPASRPGPLGDVVHEVRMPLYTICGLVELLTDAGRISGQDAEDLRQIEAAAREALRLIDSGLGGARWEAGQLDAPRPARLEVDDLFGDLRDMARPLRRSHDLRVVFTRDADLATVVTDGALLGVTLRNIVGNALKFTDAGEIAIHARRIAGGDLVAFRVSDTGIGIENASHARIFDEFERVDAANVVRLPGTGLGLPLARRLARALGGDVAMTSRLGAGSTFTVTIADPLPA
jgi:signal transduction histidine kinase